MRIFAALALALVLCPFLVGCGGEAPPEAPAQFEPDDSNPSQTD